MWFISQCNNVVALNWETYGTTINVSIVTIHNTQYILYNTYPKKKGIILLIRVDHTHALYNCMHRTMHVHVGLNWAFY